MPPTPTRRSNSPPPRPGFPTRRVARRWRCSRSPPSASTSIVVSGTDEGDLALGPGHYLGTAMPGQAGNVAIAGHRTTHGAPFNRLAALGAGRPDLPDHCRRAAAHLRGGPDALPGPPVEHLGAQLLRRQPADVDHLQPGVLGRPSASSSWPATSRRAPPPRRCRRSPGGPAPRYRCGHWRGGLEHDAAAARAGRARRSWSRWALQRAARPGLRAGGSLAGPGADMGCPALRPLPVADQFPCLPPPDSGCRSGCCPQRRPDGSGRRGQSAGPVQAAGGAGWRAGA